MKLSRISVVALAAFVVAASALPAGAVRVQTRPLLLQRTAVSGYLGGGIPVGEFSSSRLGDGNHESWPLDWAIEVEHFFGRTWSLGFSAANTTYEDKTFLELETHLSTFSAFFRVVVPTASPVRPYIRAGMGGVQVQFQDDESRVQAESKFSLQVGGGLLWLPDRSVGLNAQILYYNGSTEEAYISATDQIVGFDTKYFTFTGGVSIFFP